MKQIKTQKINNGLMKALIITLTATTVLCQGASAQEVIPANGNTQVYTSPNGVNVVDIANPNAAGLSHNQFTYYNVPANGLVLNNGDANIMARQSQLAGQVMANMNLSHQASLILNEVVAANRSILAGYTEVLGGAADVIVANPFGITCNGCGFINVPNATLTTGTPQINGGGQLTGLRVDSGDILITGEGLDAVHQNYLALIGRAIKLEGQVNAKDLDIVAGANDWDVNSKTATPRSPAGTAPTLAIDSSSLGGMYADRIRLIATEAGVGVKMLGEAAAGVGDFTLTSAGKIEIGTAISAERDVKITSAASGSDAIKATDSKISSKRDTTLTATSGEVKLAGGIVTAVNDLAITSASLADSSTTTSVTDNNKRYAGHNIELTQTGAASVNGTIYGAANDISGTFDSLTVGANGATIYGQTLTFATVNDIVLATSKIKTLNAISLVSTSGDVTLGNGVIQSTAGAVTINAGDSIENTGGTITSDNAAVTLKASTSLFNSGTIYAKTNLVVSDTTDGSTETIDNDGTIIADDHFTIKGVSLDNSGTMQSANASTINVTGALTNSNKLILSTASSALSTIVASTISNLTGAVIQAADDAEITFGSSLANTGKILAGDALTVGSNTTSATITNNAAGIIQAGGALSIKKDSGPNDMDLSTQAGTILGSTLDLQVSALNNTGTVQATNAATINVAGTLTNSNKIILSTATGGALSTIVANAVSNLASSVIQAADDAKITFATALTNTGKILAGDALTIGSSTTSGAITNNAAGIIQAGGALNIKKDSGPNDMTFNTQAGTVIGNALDVQLSSLNNSGTFQGGAGTNSITVVNTLTNTSAGKVIASTAGGTATITADTLSNSGIVQSAGTLNIVTATSLNNADGAKIIGTGDVSVRGSDSSYTVQNYATIQSGGELSIKGQSNGNGVTISGLDSTTNFIGNSIDFKAGAISLANGSGITASNNLTIDATGLSLLGVDSFIVGSSGNHTSTASITVSGTVSNYGFIYSGNALTLSATTIANQDDAGIAAYGTGTLNASSNFSNSGDLYAATLNLGAQGNSSTFTNTATGVINGTNIDINANYFLNYNDIFAGNNLTIEAVTFRNLIEGGDTRTWDFSTKYNHVNDGGSWDFDPDWLPFNGDTSTYRSGSETWDYYESYGTTPTSGMKARLIANGTISIINFSTALNLGSIITAPTIYVNSNQGGTPTFTNDAYDIQKEHHSITWQDEAYICDVIYLCYTTPGQRNRAEATTTSVRTAFGSNISFNSLTGSGFGLVNQGSLVTATVDDKDKTGASTTTGTSAASTTTGTTGASATAGEGAVNFAGITITIPTSPNGFFVVAQDPNSEYLIETNPKYGIGSTLSSKYMLDRLGLDPAEQQKRLGDGNYEAQLIRDQLTAQVGTNVIIPGQDEAAQMQRLMDNGVDQSTSLGLKYGKALTPEQIANLKTDMVWMVETEVMGQKVVAPVVYLSAATKAGILSGAVIAGNNIDLNLTSMTNTGGTIVGKDTLAVTSQGDIKNTSGTIKGGDVSLKSTEGSIINETYAKTSGAEGNMATTIGKTGSIESTGNLSLDAKKDIKNIGADMTAGKDADLKAGENITFDVIDDKKSSTTHSHENKVLGSSSSDTVTSSSHAIGSNLKVGGNLKSESGGDTTIRGSNVDVKGDGDVHAGGNLNILDARDVDSTSTTSNSTGVGVGGGVWGKEDSTDSKTTDKSHGSNFNIGGNGKLSSDKTLTVQGSDVATGGDLSLKGKDVKIIEGRDIETESHTKTTTTFGKVDDSGDDFADQAKEPEAEEEGGEAEFSAKAEAGAEAESSDSGGVTLGESTTDTKNKYSNTSKSSNIKSGGNMKIEADNDALIRGSNVEAGGDVDLSGKNVNIEAGEDINTESTSHSKTQIGLYGESNNKAGANAGAEFNADSGGASASAKGSKSGAGAGVNAGNASADASASAGAEASTDNTVDVMRTKTTNTDTKDVTHTASSIKSGGNTKIKAAENLNVKGSDLEAGGDMDLDAKDMKFEAAEDSHTSTTKTSTTKVGLYSNAGADAKAEAGANASVDGLDASANASVEANAEAGVGLKGTNTTSNHSEGSTTARTSTIKSGGNTTRNAENKITDEGTQIDAGGDFTQSSKEWESKAAKNTSWSSDDSETNTAKLGLYGEAGASASGGASVQGGTENESDVGASAGIKASYNRDTSGEKSSSSEAVVSNIKSGGNMKTTTTGKTSLEGTNLESGGDMEMNAGSLDYKAAKNTSSSSKSSDNIKGELKVGVDATKAVTGSIAGGYENSNESDSSSHDVAGGMKSGGNMKVNVKDDAHFVGTNLEAGGDASVKAGGDLKFDAARDTESHTDDSMNASASLSASKSKGSSGKGSTGMGLEAEFGMENNKSSSSTGTAGSIKSGGKMDVSAGKSATFEGTNLESGGDMNIEAKDDVNFNAVKDTKSEEGYGIDASLKASKGGKDKEGNKEGNSMGLDASGSYNKSNETTETGSTIKSGGGVKVKSGGDTNLTGTGIESEGKTSIDAGKSVNFKAAEDTSESIGVEGGISLSKKSANTDSKGTKAKEGEEGAAESKGAASFGIEGGKSNTKKAGSINAGEIEVNAGKDANFEGTQMDSKGDASIKAGGDVNFKAAESSSVEGKFSADTGSTTGVTGAGVSGGVTKEGVGINTGGNLKVDAGNNIKMEGTKANVEGSADVTAGGKIEKKTNVSGGGSIGLDRAGAEIDVQQTDINAKGGVKEKSGN